MYIIFTYIINVIYNTDLYVYYTNMGSNELVEQALFTKSLFDVNLLFKYYMCLHTSTKNL